ncbi:acyl carrier protein [Pusillimonas sp. SM2304]|uniref:acyl carrier protein n=1 Tax=Pusillimonas sp. SM2304 TaxID=3073241 RepID=UPI0028771E23|nr:acyl carrier protein [Pusillimonas sp. SM2304]MDS1141166.1 acyl carrier protein [Pusillimonas sp. SM2304]
MAVLTVIGTVLKVQVGPDTSRADLAAWDSLKHVEIMFALEDEFGIVFSEEELSGLNSVKAIIQRIVDDEA